MRKLSDINENVLTDIIDRSRTGGIRKEDGKIVHTCLGIDVLLREPHFDYDKLIEYIFSDDEYLKMSILRLKDLSLSIEEISNIRNFKTDYEYMIYDGYGGTSLVVEFVYYPDLEEDDLEYTKEDYISICRCIATKLKEVGEYITYVPKKSSRVSHNNFVEKFSQDYQLCIIQENDVYRWMCNNEDEEDFLDNFISDMMTVFPLLEYENFITWTYNDGVNIALPLNIDNINDFKEYKEFAQNWFKI